MRKVLVLGFVTFHLITLTILSSCGNKLDDPNANLILPKKINIVTSSDLPSEALNILSQVKKELVTQNKELSNNVSLNKTPTQDTMDIPVTLNTLPRTTVALTKCLHAPKGNDVVIEYCSIELNSFYFKKYSSTYYHNTQFLKNTIHHELGHAFGLAHFNDKSHIMYWWINMSNIDAPDVESSKLSRFGRDLFDFITHGLATGFPVVR